MKIVLSGIGGYGYYYLQTILNDFPPGRLRLAGIVDPSADKYGCHSGLKQSKIPVFDTLDDFYSSGETAALAVISLPIQYHVRQSCTALENGSDVLREKPIAAIAQYLNSDFHVISGRKSCIKIFFKSFELRVSSCKSKTVSFGFRISSFGFCIFCFY